MGLVECYICSNLCRQSRPIINEDTKELKGYCCHRCDLVNINKRREACKKYNKTKQGLQNVIKANTKYKKRRFGPGKVVNNMEEEYTDEDLEAFFANITLKDI